MLNSATTVNANEWHHVAVLCNGRTMQIYVDGKQDESRPFNHSIGENDFDVLIGANAELKDRSFNGLIDDVRIYIVVSATATFRSCTNRVCEH